MRPGSAGLIGSRLSYRRERVQENGGSAAAARLPKGFPIVLLHELADSCQVGDDVEVTGILQLQLQGTVVSGAVHSTRELNPHHVAV